MQTSPPFTSRWQALKQLWLHRSYWRLAEPRQILRNFRNQQLVEMMPFFIVVAALAGGLMFVLIPSLLPEQAAEFTSFIWPSWVATAAPMICAQTMALLVAPAMALELIERHQSGQFKTMNTAYGGPAGNPCISWVVALSAVCVVASYVMILFSIVLGLGVALILSIGDVRATFDAVLLAAPPIKWLRTGSTAAILGAVCGVSVVLHAWPGTAFSNSVGDTASHTHRLGLRVMLTCSIVVALTGVAINAVIGLFDKQLV
jgi:hypothetical protein